MIAESAKSRFSDNPDPFRPGKPPFVGTALVSPDSSADFQSAVSPTSSRQSARTSCRVRVGNPRYSRLETCATTFSTVLAILLLNASNSAAAPLVTPEREQALLKEVKIPDGFEAAIFATAPAVNYPVFVAAAPDGTLFVSSDKNGSLDRGPHRGRILRVRDLDNDGHADEVKEFVKDVDSPRGLFWDKDRLYLLHPPHLSVFIDHNNDGESDEQKILVKNIAFTFKDRPADHSSNGIELGVDGWIYCAIGDFGFMQAEGTDGRKLQLRGGGVVRLRPDGTNLELYSRGTRNILEVAVSPTLDMFARDNTNDGDGWDIRFHHFTPLSEHGYPSLFKNFADEIIQPLAIYGGGSGCGAMFLSEPGFPDSFNNQPYTADWGREWVYRHPLTPNGATFKVDQHEFVRAPRVTDLDVDGSSRIYVASWKGASFTYVGEDVGFVIQVKPKGYTPEPLLDFAKSTTADLISAFESPSHIRRLAAQRELLRRTPSASELDALRKLANDQSKPLPTRVLALFSLKQVQGTTAHPFLSELAQDRTLREFAIRALADRPDQLDQIPTDQITSGLRDENPRVRREAAFALARLGEPNHAPALTPLLVDPDPIVAHTTMQSLRRLQAAEPCFKVIDDPAASTELRAAAVRVLQALHQPTVVQRLLNRLRHETIPARRQGLITALARLYFTDGEWKGDSWGTRPDTTGPYYQPVEWSESPGILAALKQELEQGSRAQAAFIVQELGRHKIQSEDTLTRVISLAAEDKTLVPSALSQLARADKLPPQATSLLIATATGDSSEDTPRAHAVVGLSKIRSEEALTAMLKALPHLGDSTRGSKEFQQARQAFLRNRNADQFHELLEREAAKLNSETSPWADAALLVLSENKNASPEARAAAQRALDSGWSEPKRAVQILRAITLAEHRASKEKVLAAFENPDPEIAEAARRTARALRFERELKKKAEPQIADLNLTNVITTVLDTTGDPKLGAELFTRQTCANCHTVSADEPLKGPFLGNIANTYKRQDLAEAILIPNKTLAQGFVANSFVLKNGDEHEGFVIQEAADKVVIRNVAAQEIQIAVSDIAQRRKLEKSLMPEGLAANLTVKELASLIAYLESLAQKDSK